ncbi:CBS domain-containing protein [Sphingomonas sp. UBA4815]|jgi:CBS domain-containing protein|uniref:CBS domain-containing protein n=1 Tax=Sphingomonas sp. UBA4815 TaxID=1947533 RepID=UPI0031F50F5C
MMNANDILKKKIKQTWHISPDATVAVAVKYMSEKEVGALMVMDDKSNVLGIITERDYFRKIVPEKRTSFNTLVKDIMTPADQMHTVTPTTSVEDCMLLMTNKRIRHIPVFDGNQYVGLISIGDAVRSVISDKDFTIEQLENYIKGSYPS